MEHEHIEQICQFPNGIHNYNSNEDVDCDSSLYELVDIVQEYGNKEYINEIDDSKIPKFKFIQSSEVSVNLTKYS